MTEQEYKQAKQVLADAPNSWTHHATSSNKYFMIEGWRMLVWLGEVWSVPISNELDVLMVGDVRSLSDLRTMVEQYERIAELEKALTDAHENIGFLAMHLHGRMAEGALLEMAKKADEWKALVEHKDDE